MIDACAVHGKHLNAANIFQTRISNFTSHNSGKLENVQEKVYQVPYDTCKRHPVLKKAERINEDLFLNGMEEYAMLV